MSLDRQSDQRRTNNMVRLRLEVPATVAWSTCVPAVRPSVAATHSAALRWSVRLLTVASDCRQYTEDGEVPLPCIRVE